MRENNDRSTNRQYPDRAILFKFFPSLFCNSDKFYDEVAVLYN